MRYVILLEMFIIYNVYEYFEAIKVFFCFLFLIFPNLIDFKYIKNNNLVVH